ncbi:bifunctional acetate--CoA ligase family protein/GNAT family N-acetyltransferase [Aquisphaera insulae]|uniref:bifunctional acetate--CoA ligase family protein/GNAT family N-acetyltransferase n=1 Tax=Aquisphaera insulae TaxID=2712864 RepID=UPI0013EC99A3|nr:bifunctional acetate--CoA ligase family protein/GNAT family N-acetyltransferase [Aquisphaera insulae]
MTAAIAATAHAVPDDDEPKRLPLDAIFAPRTVAIIGATEKEGSVGRAVLRNLIDSPFGATVYPINESRANVLGIQAYPTIAAAPGAVDLAVVATPARTVPGVIAECVEAGVGGAVIISSGFKEIGAEGARLEREILDQARGGRMRIIGPNCVGVMRPYSGMNATFAARIARPGSVGFISQSGALCTAILDWSFRENVGFSAFVSVGSMIDVDWGDLIDYLGDDPYTKCIVIYMESIGDARSFLSASREVALTKPIIVIKAGRSEAAARAAASHTGALTGSDEVLDAAFLRAGVLRVESISQVFDMAEVLAKQPRPRGPRLAILTNAGGPGVLATDALIQNAGELAELSPETIAALDACLPAAWSRGNPIDILGDAGPERYAGALSVAAKDPNIDGLLAILTPQAMTDPTATAEQLRRHARISGKPVLASWMGGASVQAGEQILNQAGIPTYPYPDAAAAVFTLMWRSFYNLQGLYETPNLPAGGESAALARERAEAIIAPVHGEGRTLLTEAESKRLLAAYGIPTVRTIVADSPAAAIATAEEIGYPVVLKLHSRTITHKTDVGGVQLNLRDADAVRGAYHAIEAAVRRLGPAGPGGFEGVTVQPMVRTDGYELILGSSPDPQFGPVLLFGTGGQLVEVFRDRALGLPPLNSTLARRMMEQTRIYQALQGVRGRPAVDLFELEQLLVRFSRLVVEQPLIREIDVNPLLASPEHLLALDARVILHPPDVDLDSLPRPAIRPYPTRYVSPWTAEDGTAFTLRPIRPEDEPLLVKFHGTLSERSVSLRYFHAMKYTARVAHERLTRICFIDYDREMVLVADRRDPSTGEHEILAVGRLSKSRGTDEAEFALVVSDPFQGLGLGSELLSRLVSIGRDEGVRRIFGDILPENTEMQRICEKLRFKMTHNLQESVIRASLEP